MMMMMVGVCRLVVNWNLVAKARRDNRSTQEIMAAMMLLRTHRRICSRFTRNGTYKNTKI